MAALVAALVGPCGGGPLLGDQGGHWDHLTHLKVYGCPTPFVPPYALGQPDRPGHDLRWGSYGLNFNVGLATFLRLLEPTSVLEFGCGIGLYADYLARPVAPTQACPAGGEYTEGKVNLTPRAGAGALVRGPCMALNLSPWSLTPPSSPATMTRKPTLPSWPSTSSKRCVLAVEAGHSRWRRRDNPVGSHALAGYSPRRTRPPSRAPWIASLTWCTASR